MDQKPVLLLLYISGYSSIYIYFFVYNSYIIFCLFVAKKSTKFSSVEFSESQLSKTTPAVEHSVRCKLNDSKIHDKIEYPIESSKRPMHAASSQMEITSYLPKVKQSKSNANNIENRSSAVSSNPAAENIQRMSCEEKELVKKKILSASDVACTLLYMDGSSLLRPGAAKSQVSAWR